MLNGISSEIFLFVGIVLFSLGIFISITKKNAIMVLIGIEMIINAAILNMVTFGAFDKVDNEGQMAALFLIVLAAAGVAVALAIILNVYKHFKTIDPSKVSEMKN